MSKIAHAVKNELGTVTGGAMGDNNGMEIVVQDFFEHDWTLLFRPIDRAVAEKMALDARKIAANDCVGYGQGSDRYTMYLAAKRLNWDFGAINKPCATDCSQMIATLCIANEIEVSPYMYTGNEEGCLNDTGKFERLVYIKGMDLKAGDILLSQKRGHTAIVVEGTFPSHIPEWVGECYGMQLVPVYKDKATKERLPEWPALAAGNLFDVCDETVGYFYIRIAGKYYGWIPREYVLRKTAYTTGKATSAVNVRTNPGSQFKKIGVVEGGEAVQICDAKIASNGSVWYYIKYQDGFGFVSSRYIKEA